MDATFWATVALFIFLAVIVYYKVPGVIGRSLDARAEKIKTELAEAMRLREEAQQLLGEYQRKRKEAEAEAVGIVESAKREAAQLAAEAKQKTEDYVTRRTALAEQKIGLAEREALNEVRASAVDIAIAAAKTLLEGKVDAKLGADLFKASVQDVKSKLN